MTRCTISQASYESEEIASAENDSGQSSTASAKSSTLNSQFNEFDHDLQEDKDAHLLEGDEDEDEDDDVANANTNTTSRELNDMKVANGTVSYADYGSDSANSRDSLDISHSYTAADDDHDDHHGLHGSMVLSAAIVHEEPDSLSNARSDETGNFLLVRRNDMAIMVSSSSSSTTTMSGWWHNKGYNSSPTHTVDSGYDENVHGKRSRVTLDQVFTEEEEARTDQQKFEFARTLDGAYDNSPWQLSNAAKGGSSNWLSASFGQFSSNLPASIAAQWDRQVSQSPDPVGGNSSSSRDGSEEQTQQATGDWTKAAKCSLESSLSFLKAAISDMQGQYSQLEMFEHSVTNIYRLYKVRARLGNCISVLQKTNDCQGQEEMALSSKVVVSSNRGFKTRCIMVSRFLGK